MGAYCSLDLLWGLFGFCVIHVYYGCLSLFVIVFLLSEKMMKFILLNSYWVFCHAFRIVTSNYVWHFHPMDVYGYIWLFWLYMLLRMHLYLDYVSPTGRMLNYYMD